MRRTMMTVAALALAGLAACASGNASSEPPQAPRSVANPPSLVVLLVVDQLRGDLLDRYGDLFTGGFRRLRTEGRSYVNGSHAHQATETAVGHASIATGVHPNKHGIVGNGWYEQAGGQWVGVSNVSDPAVKIVGNPGGSGISPARLKAPGFADWLIAADSRSIVASFSGKDRGAVHPASFAKPGYVYWFDAEAGRFVTSTYYRDADPDWITHFNTTTLQAHRADTVWELRVPHSARSRSNQDTSANEGNGTSTFFPHRFSVEGRPDNFWSWWSGTPQWDAATLELARAGVTALGLGKDASPDFLNVSVSATDYIGHGYGPLSREQMDNLLSLDRHLGEFFSFLDETVGKGKWTVVLTADHGVADTPEDHIARGEYGHRVTPAERARMDTLRLNAARNPNKVDAARKLAGELEKFPFIDKAYTHEDLSRGQPRDSMELFERRSMYPGRFNGSFSREGVEIRPKRGVLSGPRGSSHGTAWWYDRSVPMIFMGPGIAPGRDPSRAETVDIAPTLAAQIGLSVPRGLDGRVLR